MENLLHKNLRMYV